MCQYFLKFWKKPTVQPDKKLELYKRINTIVKYLHKVVFNDRLVITWHCHAVEYIFYGTVSLGLVQ